MNGLQGKVAIITGSSRGIGRGIAIRLANEGAVCVLCGRDTEALRGVQNEIASAGGASAAIVADLRHAEVGPEIVNFAITRFGRLDILINNAGATKRAEFADLTDDDWQDGFAAKFFGAVRLTRAAWPHLAAVSGSVVNIAGIGGRTPGAQFALGGSVNAAILAFTKSLADTGLCEGVQVNAINPGAIRTARYERRLRDLAGREQIDLAEAEQRFLAQERITRIGEPGDIANLVAFIVGREGRYLNGSLIDMDGGATKTI